MQRAILKPGKKSPPRKGQFETHEGLWTFSTAYRSNLFRIAVVSLKSLSIPRKMAGIPGKWCLYSLLSNTTPDSDFRKKHFSAQRPCYCYCFSSLHGVWLKTQLAKEKGEARLRSLLDTMPDLVWLKDGKGFFWNVIRLFQKFFGRMCNPLLAKRIKTFCLQSWHCVSEQKILRRFPLESRHA